MAKIAKKTDDKFDWSTPKLERARDALVVSAKDMSETLDNWSKAQDEVLIDLTVILIVAEARGIKINPDAKYIDRGVIAACRDIVQTQCPDLSDSMFRKMIRVAKHPEFRALFGISSRRKKLIEYHKRLGSLCRIHGNGSKTLLGFGRSFPAILNENKTPKKKPENGTGGASNTDNRVVGASERATIKTPSKNARMLVDNLREPLAEYCQLHGLEIKALEEVLLKVCNLVDENLEVLPLRVVAKAK
tara:strand:+ start:406 stop:1143 length:738 start_codon:yes stop_codon:yes gene_type:complete